MGFRKLLPDHRDVEPVEIVGEMGLITGLSRSATIRAEKDVVFLEIAKLRLEALMRNDIDVERKLYRNMLRSLCGKLKAKQYPTDEEQF